MAHYPPSENHIAEIMEAYAKYYTVFSLVANYKSKQR